MKTQVRWCFQHSQIYKTRKTIPAFVKSYLSIYFTSFFFVRVSMRCHVGVEVGWTTTFTKHRKTWTKFFFHRRWNGFSFSPTSNCGPFVLNLVRKSILHSHIYTSLHALAKKKQKLKLLILACKSKPVDETYAKKKKKKTERHNNCAKGIHVMFRENSYR